MKVYDLAIVGARIAGASLAIQLARKGFRVALIDKAKIGSNTLSTHFMWPRGMSYLDRLGLEDLHRFAPQFETVNYQLEEESISSQVSLAHTRRRFLEVHGTDEKAGKVYSCIRRQYLDRKLIEKACEEGADYFDANLCSLSSKEGDIAKLNLLSRNGQQFSIAANIFVAADGRNSTLAHLLKLPFLKIRSTASSASYSYFSGIPAQEVRLTRRSRKGFGAASTSDGLTMLLVWGSEAEASHFQQMDEKGFRRRVYETSPDYAECFLASAKREEVFYRASQLYAFQRPSTYANTFLVGDAVCFKDQCTANGMLHALRDSELAASQIFSYLSGRQSFDQSKQLYSAQRLKDNEESFNLSCELAKMNESSIEERSLFKRMQEDHRQAQDFVSVLGDSLSISEFNLFAKKKKELIYA